PVPRVSEDQADGAVSEKVSDLATLAVDNSGPVTEVPVAEQRLPYVVHDELRVIAAHQRRGREGDKRQAEEYRRPRGLYCTTKIYRRRIQYCRGGRHSRGV